MQAPIAVLFALESESGCFEDRLQKPEHMQAAGFRTVSGKIEDVDFLVVQMGTGMLTARRTAELVCRIHTPRLVISAGFAGGLSQELKKQDLVFPMEIQTETAGSLLTAFHRLPESGLPENCHLGGRLLTVKQVVTEPERKQELGIHFQAQCTDMESYAVADVCREMGFPFLSIRVISDSMTEKLPPDVQKLIQQKTTASRWGAALKILVSRPSRAKDLYGLYQNSIDSASRLADALEALAKMEHLKFPAEFFSVPQAGNRLLSWDNGKQ